MSRTTVVANRTRLNVFILTAQDEELNLFQRLYGKNRTQIIAEALQLWINEQRRLYGEKLGIVEGGE